MTKTPTNKELREMLDQRRAECRGDAAEVLVKTITDLDALFADLYAPADIPTDMTALRNTLVATVQNFNSIADRQVEIPAAPGAPSDPNPLVPPIASFAAKAD